MSGNDTLFFDYKRIFRYLKKELISYFEEEKLFRIISLQINPLGEYSIKVSLFLFKDDLDNIKKLDYMESYFNILFKEKNEDDNNIRIKMNLRLKDMTTIEQLLEIVDKEER